MAGNLGEINVNVTADTSDFESGMVRVQKEVDKAQSTLSTKLKGLGSSMSSIGKSLTAGVTLPVVATFGLAVKAAADFDTALSKIRSVTGMTADEISNMGDAAREMADGSTFSATQVADAMYWLADSTSTAADIQDYLAGAMDLAAASGSDLSETAQVLQGLMKAYNIEASESRRVTDILTAAFQNSLWSAEEFNTAMSYVAATASQMDIPLEETAAALDVMSRAGYEASTAGAALRMGLVNLVKPTAESSRALSKYGLTADDVNPQVVGLQGALQNLHDANIDAADASKIFTVEAMGPMMSVIAASDDDFQTLVQNMKDSEGAAQEAADVMANSAAGKFKIFKDKLLDLGISIGEKLLPPLTRLLDNVVIPLFDAFENMPSGMQDMAIALAGIAAAAGPALMALGPMVSGLGSITGMLGGGGGLMSLLGGGGAAAGAGGLLGGVGLGTAAAVAAPVAAVAGVGAWAAMRDFDVDAMAQDVNGVAQFLGGIGDQIGQAIGSIDWDALLTKLATFGGDVIDALGEWFGSIDWQQAFMDSANATLKVINGIIDWFEKIDWIKAFMDAGAAAADLLNGVITWIANINWDQVGADIAYFIGHIDWIGIGVTILEGLAGLLMGIANFFVNIDWFAVLQGLANIGMAIPRMVIGALASIDWVQLAVTLGSLIWQALSAIGQAIVNFGAGLVGAAGQIVDSAIQWVVGFVGGLANGVGQLIDGAIQWVSNFINGIAAGPGQLINQAVQWISNFVNMIAQGPGQLIAQATQWVGNFINGIIPGAGDLIIKAGEWVSNFIDGIAKGVTDLLSKAGEWITSFVNGLIAAPGQIAQKAANLVSEFIGGLVPQGDVIPGLHLFAKGGYVDKPTLGVFGEAGPEWLIPDDIMQKILDLRSQAFSSAGAANMLGSVGIGSLASSLGDMVPGISNSRTTRSFSIGQLVLQMKQTNNPRAFVKEFASELKLMGFG
ncbi:MAG: phage tail tape measure protein [Actinomycetia bacterium]|nr:phage tail tape measure protein [Actinomycetes bacterium]